MPRFVLRLRMRSAKSTGGRGEAGDRRGLNRESKTRTARQVDTVRGAETRKMHRRDSCSALDVRPRSRRLIRFRAWTLFVHAIGTDRRERNCQVERPPIRLRSSASSSVHGWNRDMLRLVLAVLFRAGSIEITHAGEKFDSYQEPRSRTPLVNNTAFKSALFTPVKPINLPTLNRAVERYEELTGDTVDMDKAAIADALKRFAGEKIKGVLPIQAQVKAYGIPILGTAADYRDSLAAIESGSPDDCVTILAGEGASLKEGQDRLRKIADCLDDKGLAAIRNARRAIGEVWNQLDAQARAGLQPKADQIRELLSTDTLLDSLSSIMEATRAILETYGTLYDACHADRAAQFGAAIEKIKGREEWTAVPETMREPVLAPLQVRCCLEPHLADGVVSCKVCGAT